MVRPENVNLQFKDQKTFVRNHLLVNGSFDHYERLAVIIYTDNVIANASFGSFQTLADIFSYIDNIKQNTNVNHPKITPYVLLAQLVEYLICLI